MILKITAEKENTIAYTLDTKIGEILNDPQAVAILERYAPGTSKNPMLEMALSVLGGVNKLKK